VKNAKVTASVEIAEFTLSSLDTLGETKIKLYNLRISEWWL
jgi:hypothetical protein